MSHFANTQEPEDMVASLFTHSDGTAVVSTSATDSFPGTSITCP